MHDWATHSLGTGLIGRVTIYLKKKNRLRRHRASLPDFYVAAPRCQVFEKIRLRDTDARFLKKFSPAAPARLDLRSSACGTKMHGWSKKLACGAPMHRVAKKFRLPRRKSSFPNFSLWRSDANDFRYMACGALVHEIPKNFRLRRQQGPCSSLQPAAPICMFS